MLNNFLMFVAPFLFMFLAIFVSFWASLKDDVVKKEEE